MATAVDDLAGRYPILYLPQVTPPGLGSFDFGHTAALIEAGYRRTVELLASMADPAPRPLPGSWPETGDG